MANDYISQVTLPNNVVYDIKDELHGNARVFYGTCATGASVATKTVVCNDYDTLTIGDILVVEFTYTNLAAVNDNLKLEIVNSSDTVTATAKSIKTIYNGNIDNLPIASIIYAGSVHIFIYNGTSWLLTGQDTNSDIAVRTYASAVDIDVPLLGSNSNPNSITAAWSTYTNAYQDWHAAIPNSDALRAKINLNTGLVKIPGGIYSSTGSFTGTLSINGLVGTSAVDYGTTLPNNPSEGRVFFQISNPVYELPAGGTVGQALIKSSTADRDVTWGSVGGFMSPSADKYYVSGSSITAANSDPALFNTNVYVENNVLFGAAWNDYAEYRSIIEPIKPGKCVVETGNDELTLSTKRLQPGAEIVSDTFGFAIGQTEKCNTPIAVTGRVLAYPYEDIKQFKPGLPVCSGPNGTVSIMTHREARRYPWLIIGTVSGIPQEKTWGANNVSTEGRVWIRVR